MVRRNLSDARDFGRLMGPLLDLQPADGEISTDDALLVMDVNAVDATSQPKRATVSGLAGALAPIVAPLVSGCVPQGPEGAIQFIASNTFEGTSSLRWVSAGQVVAISGSVVASGDLSANTATVAGLTKAGSVVVTQAVSAGSVYSSGTVAASGVVQASGLIVDGPNIRWTTSGTPPLSSGSAGTKGDMRWGGDYLYFCTAPNTWKRSALAWGNTVEHPHAGTTIQSTAATPVFTPGQFVKVSGVFVPTTAMSPMVVSGNSIQYTGGEPRHFHMVSQASIAPTAGNNQLYKIGIYYYDNAAASGGVLNMSIAANTLGSTATEQITTHGDLMMKENDRIELRLTNDTNANGATVTNAYLFCMGMYML